MSEVLKKKWSVGISQTTMLTLEDTLKKCWHVVNDFESTKYSFDCKNLKFSVMINLFSSKYYVMY